MYRLYNHCMHWLKPLYGRVWNHLMYRLQLVHMIIFIISPIQESRIYRMLYNRMLSKSICNHPKPNPAISTISYNLFLFLVQLFPLDGHQSSHVMIGFQNKSVHVTIVIVTRESVHFLPSWWKKKQKVNMKHVRITITLTPQLYIVTFSSTPLPLSAVPGSAFSSP